MKEENQKNYINYYGIGVFAFLLILELSDLVQYAIESILIISKVSPKMTLWFPDVLSFVVYLALIIWAIIKFNKLKQLNSRKFLIKLIISFFILLLFQYAFTFYIHEFLMDKFSEEYDLYFDGLKGNYNLQGYVAFIPIVQYLILGILLLLKNSSQQRTELKL